MDLVSADGIFGAAGRTLANRVLSITLSIMAMKRQAPVAYTTPGPKRQGIEVGLALGSIWKSADIIIVIAILIDFHSKS